MSNFTDKVKKFVAIIVEGKLRWVRALGLGVAAGVEHVVVLQQFDCRTVVDIGANRGQFALAARHTFPDANIISFEPLSGPSKVFRRIFAKDNAVVLNQSAIGSENKQCLMHVSARDDSSSLLQFSSLQEEVFPGTGQVATVDVHVAPLYSFVGDCDIVGPALLKLDVQGFELEALRGCESLLSRFQWVYCECSFVELYVGQKYAADVIDWLSGRGFQIKGMYNPTYDHKGRTVQADLLFRRPDVDRELCGS